MYTILTADNADDLAEKVEGYLKEVSSAVLLGPPQADFSPRGDIAFWWQAITSREFLK